MKADACPACGMERATWPDTKGVVKQGKTYCCEGCAEGTGCTCEEEAGVSEAGGEESELDKM